MMDISPSGQTNEAALVQSAYEGNISNVQKLVKKGVNIDALAPCGKNR